ncbi:MAG: glucuronate isomerase [Planctomycetota bacterium]|nr:glucuronate isomerase [Planctomycetota bacterium]
MPSNTLIKKLVHAALDAQPITYLHTHVYNPRFGSSPKPGSMLLWGIDELVTYHYLVAEVYRVVPASVLPYETFWKMPKADQADHIWRHLFVERTPVSEACRGVLTTLGLLGLNPNEKTLKPHRKWFAAQKPDAYVDKVMKLAHVDKIVMTNPVFDDAERALWESDPKLNSDPRFAAVLRIDPLLRDWPLAAKRLREWGYDVRLDFTGKTVAETQRFLRHWLDKMNAIYVACSLPPDFRYPAASGNGAPTAADNFIRDVLTPVLAERNLPWALMIGSRLRVNPALNDAGDMVGQSDVLSVVNLCREFPANKFLVTMLARENQHELCVAARKFGNLMLFGCWWFLNNPSLIDEITRMRLELLGTSFIPQHSDARILDQLVYKWDHNRKLIGAVLVDKYADLQATGYKVTPAMVKRDVALLLRENFWEFLKR